MRCGRLQSSPDISKIDKKGSFDSYVATFEGGRIIMHRFLVIIEKANWNYSAYSPDLPGCIATGETREEAEKKCKKQLKCMYRV